MTTVQHLGVSRSEVAGAVIATFRSEMGWSQETMASRVGMDRSALARLETGRTALRIDDIFLLDGLFMDAHLTRGHGDLLLLTSLALNAVTGRAPDMAGPELRRVVAGVVDRWLLDLRAGLAPGRGQKAPRRQVLQGGASRGQ